MAQVLSLYLPMLSLDRRRRRLRDSSSRDQTTPLRRAVWILAEDQRGQRTVAACCERATRSGVRRGMTLAHARALLGFLPVHVEDHDPGRDAATLQALARWAVRFTPRVGTDPPDGLLMDVTGCERLYRGLPNLVRHVLEESRRVGFRARAALAPTAGCAWALARYGPSDRQIVTHDDAEAAALPLPVAAMRLSPDELEALNEVAIDRIEHLAAVPREQIADRFGASMLHRLDAVLGHVDEPLEPVRPVPPPRAERAFAGPVVRFEAIHIAARGLVESLCSELDRRRLGSLRLDLVFDRYETTPLHATFDLASPERDPRHLWALLRPTVERMNLGRGVERMMLTAARTAPLPSRQFTWRTDNEPETIDGTAVGRLVDLLKARLGPEEVLRARVVDTHVPEAAFKLEPAVGVAMAKDIDPPSPAPIPVPRPLVLFDDVEPAEVVLLQPDGPVLSLRWRGEVHRIITAIGPETISGRWWLGPRVGERSPARDYFRIQDETGRWLWVFRDWQERWFVHGTWG